VLASVAGSPTQTNSAVDLFQKQVINAAYAELFIKDSSQSGRTNEHDTVSSNDLNLTNQWSELSLHLRAACNTGVVSHA